MSLGNSHTTVQAHLGENPLVLVSRFTKRANIHEVNSFLLFPMFPVSRIGFRETLHSMIPWKKPHAIRRLGHQNKKLCDKSKSSVRLKDQIFECVNKLFEIFRDLYKFSNISKGFLDFRVQTLQLTSRMNEDWIHFLFFWKSFLFAAE